MKRLVALAVLIVASATLVAAPALAGKPGGAVVTNAWVSASPNPAAAGGARVEVSGCGYDKYYPAEVRIAHSAGYTQAYMVAVWNTSCLNVTPFLTQEAGTYTISVYQRTSKRKNAAPVLKASTVLTVQ